MKTVRFLDALYGRIEVSPRERDLFFSPEFQRLRFVRLCNINSLFVTGASEPSRFEHCVGVYHLAARWAERVQLTPDAAHQFKSAALLHDLQTGPFGHSFQYVLEDNLFDERFEHANLEAGSEQNFHQRTERAMSFAGHPFTVPALLGPHFEGVSAAVRGAGPLGPLISGSLDLDNLDNVVRLAFHVGLCTDEDRRLPEKLVDRLGIRQGSLTTDEAGKSLIERWYEIRRELYHYLLLDRGEFSAKAMLTRAVELAVESRILWPDHWVLTDDELIAFLERESIGATQAIGQTTKRLAVGDLYGEIGVWSVSQTDLYDKFKTIRSKRALERSIEDAASSLGIEKLRVCVHLIVDKKKTCRKIEFYNTTTSATDSVGVDSNILHVGIFFTNNRAGGISDRALAGYRSVVEEELRRVGADNPTLAPDPLYPDLVGQLPLANLL